MTLAVEGQADSSLSLDSSLAHTTNANLVQTGAESDQIVRIGGLWRFPFSDGAGRLSLRYANYFKFDENDLLSADLGNTWKASKRAGETNQAYSLRLSMRNYVNQDVGTTDQGFTHYGVIGNVTLSPPGKNSPWTYVPQIDLEHYPNLSRSDIEVSFRVEYDSLVGEVEKGFVFSATPGILASSSSDFSRAFLALSGDYEATLDSSSSWGAGLAIVPSFYTARVISSTVLSTGRQRGRSTTGTVVVNEKERTTLLSPSVWYSKTLTPDWLGRLEAFGSFQSSKSGTYNYSEVQLLASVRYRVF